MKRKTNLVPCSQIGKSYMLITACAIAKRHCHQHDTLHSIAFWLCSFADCDGCRVDIAEAAGRISAELLCPYPPGIPLVVPGESISSQDIHALQAVLAQNGRVKGPNDPLLRKVQVVVA